MPATATNNDGSLNLQVTIVSTTDGVLCGPGRASTLVPAKASANDIPGDANQPDGLVDADERLLSGWESSPLRPGAVGGTTPPKGGGVAREADAAAQALAAAVAAAARATARALIELVMAKRMDFWAPMAKRALAACLLGPKPPPLLPPKPGQKKATKFRGQPRSKPLTVRVEAWGSGTIVIPSLSFDPKHTTVGDLKRRVAEAAAAAAAATGVGASGVSDGGGARAAVVDGAAAIVRLYVGHGGPELSSNDRSVRNCKLVKDGAVLVRAFAEPKAGRPVSITREQMVELRRELAAPTGDPTPAMRAMGLTPKDEPYWTSNYSTTHFSQRYRLSLGDNYYTMYRRYSVLDFAEYKEWPSVAFLKAWSYYS